MPMRAGPTEGREREGMWADAGRDRDHAGLPGDADADADRATCSIAVPSVSFQRAALKLRRCC